MKIKEMMKLCASSAPPSLTGRMPLVMLMLSAVLMSSLTSCQSYYNSPYPVYPQGTPLQGIVYERPPAKVTTIQKAPPGSSRKTTKSAAFKTKRMPKLQSTYIDPPLPTHGYHARLDMTPYPIMGNKPFYRVLSPYERWNMSESAFWYWYNEVKKHGANPKVLIRMFDPYSPSAPPASTSPRR